jgi:biotin carboxylase
MPNLLLLLPSSTYRAEAFLDAATKLRLDVTLGVEPTAVLPDRPASKWLSLKLNDTDRCCAAVAAYARTCPIHAVVGVDDRTALLAAQIASHLGLPHNPVGSVRAAGNKYRMRTLFQQFGLPVPRFTRLSIHEDPAVVPEGITYPSVLKPLALSASCGVIRVNNPREYAAAFQRITTLLHTLGATREADSGQHVLVEDFIPGQEVALEGLMTAGSLQMLALFDKPDPLDGPFFEETMYVTPSRLSQPDQTRLIACAETAATALGLREGPIHAELRINDAGIWVIELAARSIGGRCSRMLRFTGGLSLEELIVRHALRMELPPLNRDGGASGVMMLPIPKGGVLREIHGEQTARAVPGIEEVTVTAQIGDELVPLPEGTRYLGFIVARADSPAGVEASLRQAHRCLDFVVEASARSTGESIVRPDGPVQSIRF